MEYEIKNIVCNHFYVICAPLKRERENNTVC